MTNHIIVTSFNDKGFEQYGRVFLASYLKYWHQSVSLLVYYESECDRLDFNLHGRAEVISLNSIPTFASFIPKYENDPYATGKKQQHIDHLWKSKNRDEGYNFRYDAVKFSKKVFAVHDAVHRVPRDTKLYWIDADVVTLKTVPPDFLDKMLPVSYDISFLGRAGYHTECGFVGYNVSSDRTVCFVDTFCELYITGKVFSLAEWHDSFVFDQVRKKYVLKEYDLPSRHKGHVWITSPLVRYMDHLKGGRKSLGRSPELDRLVRK